MSLNYPTAFWKQESVEAAPDTSATISWSTGLYWSHDPAGNSSSIGVTEPFPIQQYSSYPFIVNIDPDNFDDEYFSYYSSTTTLITEGLTPNDANGFPSDRVFYGWYLTGGINSEGVEVEAPHRAEPWIVEQNGLYVSLNFEADGDSAIDRDADLLWGDAVTKWNSFIQSGSATGTFTLGSPTAMTVQVSGLGRDSTWPASWADYYDSMTLEIYDVAAETSTLLCSGKAPEDERFKENATPAIGRWDMQQSKLYSGNNLNTIINYQGKNGGTAYPEKGAVRNTPNALVDEDDRTIYINDNGTGVFSNKGTSTPLSAGTYQIRINASTMDGTYSSGAFYGFKFTFS